LNCLSWRNELVLAFQELASKTKPGVYKFFYGKNSFLIPGWFRINVKKKKIFDIEM